MAEETEQGGKRSGKRRFFLFVLLSALVAGVASFLKRRRGRDLEEGEWQELPPPAGG